MTFKGQTVIITGAAGNLGHAVSAAFAAAGANLVLLDLKSFDAELHYRLTGQDVAPVHDFARRLAAAKRPVWVRFVLVPGVTDNADDIARNAAFAASLGNVERVDVLPFHQMGAFKWKRLKFDYKLEGVEPPTPEAVERACAQFRAAGLNAPH